MTIFEHPLWPTLLKHLYLRRGVNGVNGPRQRIEVRHDAPQTIFDIEVSCAHCGALMHPIRRDRRGAWTFNVSCPLAVSVRCARMPESHATASAVRTAMDQR
jgi:hypothetical protein